VRRFLWTFHNQGLKLVSNNQGPETATHLITGHLNSGYSAHGPVGIMLCQGSVLPHSKKVELPIQFPEKLADDLGVVEDAKRAGPVQG